MSSLASNLVWEDFLKTINKNKAIKDSKNMQKTTQSHNQAGHQSKHNLQINQMVAIKEEPEEMEIIESYLSLQNSSTDFLSPFSANPSEKPLDESSSQLPQRVDLMDILKDLLYRSKALKFAIMKKHNLSSSKIVKSFQCGKCSKVFQTHTALGGHISRNHQKVAVETRDNGPLQQGSSGNLVSINGEKYQKLGSQTEAVQSENASAKLKRKEASDLRSSIQDMMMVEESNFRESFEKILPKYGEDEIPTMISREKNGLLG